MCAYTRDHTLTSLLLFAHTYTRWPPHAPLASATAGHEPGPPLRPAPRAAGAGLLPKKVFCRQNRRWQAEKGRCVLHARFTCGACRLPFVPFWLAQCLQARGSRIPASGYASGQRFCLGPAPDLLAPTTQ
jgi:hypothetical protein